MDAKLVERFHQKYIKDEGGCWLWTASCAGKGYGQIKVSGERINMYAHRLSYWIHKGEDPGRKQVCHTCDNPKCVNPDHLFIGTSQENHDDMVKKDRHTRGERSATAKLSEKEVLQLKDCLSLDMTQKQIAAAFQISQVQVSRIKTGQQWTYLKKPKDA